MSIKALILKLEKFFKEKYPELDAGFCISKRNMCAHMGLNKAILSHSSYKEMIQDYKNFFEKHLTNKFIVNVPQLIHAASGNLII